MVRMTRRGRLISSALVILVVAVLAGGIALGALPVGRATSGALGAPHFVDETATAGLDHTYDGDETYDVGGGVAVLDCDDDGRPDVYAAGGQHPAGLFRNVGATGGALRFEPVGRDSGADLSNVTGAYPLDVDGDGIIDLAVLRVGQSELLRGLGGCRFQRADEAWGATPTPGYDTAFSATWEGDAARPTMAFGRYLTLLPSGDVELPCAPNVLMRPGADGATYQPPAALEPGFCALSMLFSDWDGSGRRDLRVSNDRHYYDNEVGQEQLWRFESGVAPRLYTAADGWALLRLFGMGIASYDVTGDGRPEVYLTSQGANTMQTLRDGPARPAFRDMANNHGIEGTRPAAGGDPLPSTAWHPEFQDVNNDGYMDLFVSKGNVNVQPDFASRDPSDLWLGQPDGSYVQAVEAAGIAHFDRGRGAALADFNLDGLLDLVELNLSAPVRVWRNVGSGTAQAPTPMGTWVAWRVRDPGAPNRDAIGAQVDVRVGETPIGRRELVVGGGHIGGQLGWTTTGIGRATEAEIRVTWPDGEQGPWQQVTAGSFVTIERGRTSPVPWTPPAPTGTD